MDQLLGRNTGRETIPGEISPPPPLGVMKGTEVGYLSCVCFRVSFLVPIGEDSKSALVGHVRSVLMTVSADPQFSVCIKYRKLRCSNLCIRRF